MSVRVNDKLPVFKRSVHQVFDDAIREGARDTLKLAKQRAPFRKGGLRRESEVHRVIPMWWRVSFWIEYARFQEFGGDSKRRVRQYTSSGTNKHFLKRSGDEQVNKMGSILRKHARRARA